MVDGERSRSQRLEWNGEESPFRSPNQDAFPANKKPA